MNLLREVVHRLCELRILLDRDGELFVCRYYVVQHGANSVNHAFDHPLCPVGRRRYQESDEQLGDCRHEVEREVEALAREPCG
jgi:hypothetical protein